MKLRLLLADLLLASSKNSLTSAEKCLHPAKVRAGREPLRARPTRGNTRKRRRKIVFYLSRYL